jgi:hypothetical protein
MLPSIARLHFVSALFLIFNSAALGHYHPQNPFLPKINVHLLMDERIIPNATQST